MWRALDILPIFDAPLAECISAFGFVDPAPITAHVGLNVSIQKRLNWHAQLIAQISQRVKNAIVKALWEGKTQAVIAIYCKSGRHRSVAMAEILAGVLSRDGLNVDLPVHLSSWFWRYVHCQKQYSRCWHCSQEYTEEKICFYDFCLRNYWAPAWN